MPGDMEDWNAAWVQQFDYYQEHKCVKCKWFNFVQGGFECILSVAPIRTIFAQMDVDYAHKRHEEESRHAVSRAELCGQVCRGIRGERRDAAPEVQSLHRLVPGGGPAGQLKVRNHLWPMDGSVQTISDQSGLSGRGRGVTHSLPRAKIAPSRRRAKYLYA